MLCEKCKKNEAKINLVKIVNGQKQQIWLCEECARNISSIPIMGPVGDENIFPVQDIINGLLSSVENNIPEKAEKVVCKKCGTTIDEVKKTGILGCSECYRVFSEIIKAKLKEKNNNHDYCGNMPKEKSKDLLQKKELKKLKYELQILVQNEEYEEASTVRDRIKELEFNIIQSNLKGDEEQLGEEKFNGKLDS